jgi:hypothetical protein
MSSLYALQRIRKCLYSKYLRKISLNSRVVVFVFASELWVTSMYQCSISKYGSNLNISIYENSKAPGLLCKEFENGCCHTPTTTTNFFFVFSSWDRIPEFLRGLVQTIPSLILLQATTTWPLRKHLSQLASWRVKALDSSFSKCQCPKCDMGMAPSSLALATYNHRLG